MWQFLVTHHIFLIYLLCVGCVINTFLWHTFCEINLQYKTIELYIVPLYLHQFVMKKTYPFPGLSFTSLAVKLAWLESRESLYKIVVPTVVYGAEAWSMRSAERSKVNVLEIKYSRSLVGVSWTDNIRNEEVCRRAGIEKELASRVDQRPLRWLGMWGVYINLYLYVSYRFKKVSC